MFINIYCCKDSDCGIVEVFTPSRYEYICGFGFLDPRYKIGSTMQHPQ